MDWRVGVSLGRRSLYEYILMSFPILRKRSTSSCRALCLNLDGIGFGYFPFGDLVTLCTGGSDSLFLVISAATVIKVTDVCAIEDGLAFALVDLVMHKTCPSGSVRSRRGLRRVFLQEFLEVLGAFTTGIESGEEKHVLVQGFAFVDGWLVGESGHGGVKDFPCGST